MSDYDFAKQKNHHPGWANYDGGKKELAYGYDLMRDPADTDDDNDPVTGYQTPVQRISEV